MTERSAMLFAASTVKFFYQGMEGIMMIDFITANNLELVSNTLDRHGKATLFHAINHTTTPMGARLLRTNLLQPSTRLATVTDRLNAVQELVRQESVLFGLQAALKPAHDLDKTIANLIRMPCQKQDVHYAESKINYALQLKSLLLVVTSVCDRMGTSECTLLRRILDVSMFGTLGCEGVH